MRRTRASNYRHKITIQKNTVSRGTTGEAVEVWKFFASRWASVEPLVSIFTKEKFVAQQFMAESTTRIKMRYDDKMDGANVRDYQITFNNKTYNIQAILNVFELNQELHFMCSILNE